MTIWKTIPDFSNYEASNLGDIRNKNTKLVFAKNSLRGGYIRVTLTNNNNERKTITIHRLIAITFIPNPYNKYTVNHINHNKIDNRVENLEWATTTEQNRHKRKVSDKKKRLVSSRKVWRIDINTNEKLQLYETIRDAAKWVFDNKLTSVKEFNNGNNIKTRICAVCRKKREITYGYKWCYDTTNEDKYENEYWKPIPKELINNIEGYYISSFGRVKNHKGRITEGHNKPNDYVWCSIYPKQYLLHILLAKVFLPNFYGKNIVNHKDGNKTNCKLFNLEWNTPSENTIHAHKNGLINKNKSIICECGCSINLSSLNRHKISKKHYNLINKIK